MIIRRIPCFRQGKSKSDSTVICVGKKNEFSQFSESDPRDSSLSHPPASLATKCPSRAVLGGGEMVESER